MQPAGPIYTAHLFPELHNRLIALLKGLTPEEWQAPTICSPWTVKDLAAHLLQGDLGRLTFHRDRWPRPKRKAPDQGYSAILELINNNNHEWVQAATLISPSLLIQFHEVTGPQLCAYFASLDPHKPAPVSVLWAGEDSSYNWFDIAREYTEKWMHQQQIRDATGRPALYERPIFYPVLDTFIRALPYAYRTTEADNGTAIVVEISGEAGGAWTLYRQEERWMLYHGAAENANAHVTLDQDTAWRLFTKGISHDVALAKTQFAGDLPLAKQVLETVSIMA